MTYLFLFVRFCGFWLTVVKMTEITQTTWRRLRPWRGSWGWRSSLWGWAVPLTAGWGPQKKQSCRSWRLIWTTTPVWNSGRESWMRFIYRVIYQVKESNWFRTHRMCSLWNPLCLLADFVPGGTVLRLEKPIEIKILKTFLGFVEAGEPFSLFDTFQLPITLRCTSLHHNFGQPIGKLGTTVDITCDGIHF